MQLALEEFSNRTAEFIESHEGTKLWFYFKGKLFKCF
jgi:hypothetical protein